MLYIREEHRYDMFDPRIEYVEPYVTRDPASWARESDRRKMLCITALARFSVWRHVAAVRVASTASRANALA